MLGIRNPIKVKTKETINKILTKALVKKRSKDFFRFSKKLKNNAALTAPPKKCITLSNQFKSERNIAELFHNTWPIIKKINNARIKFLLVIQCINLNMPR